MGRRDGPVLQAVGVGVLPQGAAGELCLPPAVCPEDKPSAVAHGLLQTLSSRKNGVKIPKGPILHPLQRGTAGQARGTLAGEASGRPGLRQWEGVAELGKMYEIQACLGALAVCLYSSLS